MIRNFFVIALRQFQKNSFYSIINLLGFALGLTTCLLISFYVYDELSFDRMIKDSDQIYRVLTIDDTETARSRVYAITSGLLIQAAKEEIPEVVAGTRFAGGGQGQLRRGDIEESAEETDFVTGFMLMADSSFFNVFDMEFIAGDKDRALRDPGGIIISERIAKAVFGDDDPIDKPLQMPGFENAHVVAVIESYPENCHIHFEILAPLIINEGNEMWFMSWDNIAGVGYLKLHDGADPQLVENKLLTIARANNFAGVFTCALQECNDIHLGSSDYKYDFINFGKNDATRVYALLIIAIMVLVIASVNFINLSSARAAKRAREVGMRKVVGAHNTQLAAQFLGESILVTTVAMIIALIVTDLTLPMLSNYVGKELDADLIHNPLLALGLLGGSMLVGLLAGIYPTAVLTQFRPIMVLKGDFRFGKQGVLLRRVLVVTQFAITIGLILGVLLVREQIKHIRTLDLGYQRDQVAVIPTFGRGMEDARNNLYDRLQTIPSVESVGSTWQLPGRAGDMMRVEVVPEGHDRETQAIMFKSAFVDENFFDPLKIQMSMGRNFSRDFGTDSAQAVLINETALKAIGWDDPIGRRIDLIGVDGNPDPKRIIGVFKDVHFGNARQAVEPIILNYSLQPCGWVLVRIRGGEIGSTLEQIESLYAEIIPERQFNRLFMDELFDRQFQGDRQFATAIAVFSSLAILIACLGLFGLSSYTVEQQRREIAVRKVLGSSESRIVARLVNQFLKWVLIANIVAWPAAYYGISLWLDSFVYKMPFKPLPFIYSGMAALLIALLTVLTQSIRASRANPAVVLKDDN